MPALGEVDLVAAGAVLVAAAGVNSLLGVSPLVAMLLVSAT